MGEDSKAALAKVANETNRVLDNVERSVSSAAEKAKEGFMDQREQIERRMRAGDEITDTLFLSTTGSQLLGRYEDSLSTIEENGAALAKKADAVDESIIALNRRCSSVMSEFSDLTDAMHMLTGVAGGVERARGDVESLCAKVAVLEDLLDEMDKLILAKDTAVWKDSVVREQQTYAQQRMEQLAALEARCKAEHDRREQKRLGQAAQGSASERQSLKQAAQEEQSRSLTRRLEKQMQQHREGGHDSLIVGRLKEGEALDQQSLGGMSADARQLDDFYAGIEASVASQQPESIASNSEPDGELVLSDEDLTEPEETEEERYSLYKEKRERIYTLRELEHLKKRAVKAENYVLAAQYKQRIDKAAALEEDKRAAIQSEDFLRAAEVKEELDGLLRRRTSQSKDVAADGS